jgi:hypothetical protein
MFKKLGILTLVLAALVGGTLAAPNFELQIGELPKASALDVKARDLSLICPGPLFKAGGVNGNVLGEFSAVGQASFAYSFNPKHGAALKTADANFIVDDLAGQEAQGSDLLNVNQVQVAAGATLNGLAATNCQLPGNEAWLIGGSTTVGREALLILKNPTAVDSTVNLQIFSEGGSVDAPGLNGIAVVAGKTTVVPLSGIIPNTKTFVTHVVARGGAVATWIQQRTVRGLTAGGLDYISPAPVASKSIVVPGIFIRGAKEAQKLISANANYGDVKPIVRVFVPGASSATVTAQIFGATSKTYGTVVRATVNGAATTDLEIPGLEDGNYVAVISADSPIYASVRLPRSTSGKAPDFAWLNAAEEFTGVRKITAPSVGISKICIYNTDTGAIEVSVVSPGATYSFGGGAKVAANLIVDVDGTVGALEVLDQKNAGGKVEVNVR